MLNINHYLILKNIFRCFKMIFNAFVNKQKNKQKNLCKFPLMTFMISFCNKQINVLKGVLYEITINIFYIYLKMV